MLNHVFKKKSTLHNGKKRRIKSKELHCKLNFLNKQGLKIPKSTLWCVFDVSFDSASLYFVFTFTFTLFAVTFIECVHHTFSSAFYLATNELCYKFPGDSRYIYICF